LEITTAWYRKCMWRLGTWWQMWTSTMVAGACLPNFYLFWMSGVVLIAATTYEAAKRVFTA